MGYDAESKRTHLGMFSRIANDMYQGFTAQRNELLVMGERLLSALEESYEMRMAYSGLVEEANDLFARVRGRSNDH